MQEAFWLDVWREHRIGFHRSEPLPLLIRHWPALALPPGSRVLVPLCGKSPDLAWLAAQGHRVLGVELSPIAVEEFFTEHALVPERQACAFGTRHVAGAIEIVQGNVFDLDAATLAGCAAVYDRAALVALPADMRERYVRGIYGRLPRGCRGLLVALDYPQAEMDGPPFAVDAAMVQALFAPDWQPEQVERRDILAGEPHFRAAGLSAFHTSAWRLTHTP